PWAVAAGEAAQADRARDGGKRYMKFRMPELATATGEQKVWGSCLLAAQTIPLIQQAVAPLRIASQRAAGGGVQWYQARLGELTAANGEHPALEVHILAPERECFAHPQAGDRKQAQQRAHGPGAQRLARRQTFGRRHQQTD